MTELQFERVFNKAQELQTQRLTKKEMEDAERALRGFEQDGVLKVATVAQAAYILNMVCMDITGGYQPNTLTQVREYYLKNVSIKGDKSKKKKTGKRK